MKARARRWSALAAIAGAGASIAACSGDDAASAPAVAPSVAPATDAISAVPGTTRATTTTTAVTVADPATSSSASTVDDPAVTTAAPIGAECAERPAARVTNLPDIEVPAAEVPAVTTPSIEISGERVDGTIIEGIVIPAQTVDAGCVIEHDAPGGCLGAVEITAARLPAADIPASVIPAVQLPDGQAVAEEVIAGVTAAEVVAPAVRTEAVCQIEEAGELSTVSRAGIVRPAIARNGVARPAATRPERCVDGACVPAVRITAVRLEPLRLPDVDIAPARLQRREPVEDVADIEGAGETSYVTSADVLFDTDQAVIRVDAEAALGEIARRILAVDPGTAIRIEGHTDDRADEAYNVELSQRRAQAVADWLVTRGGIDGGRITVTGLGETTPAFPNDTEEQRQLNRRVAITVDG